MNDVEKQLFPLIKKLGKLNTKDAKVFSSLMETIFTDKDSEHLISRIFTASKTALNEEEQHFLENIFRLAVNSVYVKDQKKSFKVSFCLVSLRVIPKTKEFTPIISKKDYDTVSVFKKHKLMNAHARGFVAPIYLSTDFIWKLNFNEVDRLFKGILNLKHSLDSSFLEGNEANPQDHLFLPLILEENVAQKTDLIDRLFAKSELDQALFYKDLSEALSDDEKEVEVNAILPFYEMRSLIKSGEMSILYESNLETISEGGESVSRVLITREDTNLEIKFLNKENSLLLSYEVKEPSLNDSLDLMEFSLDFFDAMGYELVKKDSHEIILKSVGHLH